MKYLLDSSAIFKAIKENKIDVLVGNCTLELARYELGNILWKSFALEGKATMVEIKSLAKIVKRVLGIMEVLQIDCSEEEILEIANKAEITFYDASYVYYAKAKNLTLVTEDIQLLKKIANKISASTLSDIVSQ
ncbi:MAG: type II toxin-antitoxin system VapC family toxin [Candidatus Bathyarchaeia archaeon]